MKLQRRLVAIGSVVVALVWAGAAAAQEAPKPKVPSHDNAGREQCLMCHGGAMEGMPAAPATSHEGRENDTCLLCHSATSPMQTATPSALSHDVAGREQCTMCHSGAMESVPAVPANHEGIEVKFCGLCHKPAG